MSLLEPQRERGDGDGEFLVCHRSDDFFRLSFVGPFHENFLVFPETAVANRQDLFYCDVSGHCQSHVVEVIEVLITAVKKVCRNVGDGLFCPGNVHPDRVPHIESFQKVEKHLPARVVEVHADLLPDDALLLLHGRFREVGVLDEVEEDLQVFLEMRGAGKEVTGPVEAGVGVGAGTGLREPLKGVEFFTFKEFMFEEMGRAPGQLFLFSAPDFEGVVDGPVIGPDDGIGSGIPGFRVDENGKAGVVENFVIGVPQEGVFMWDDLCHVSPPPRHRSRSPSEGRPCPGSHCLPYRSHLAG